MNQNFDIDLLEQVKKVDAPSFLYTRIQARIEAIRESKLKPKWVWAASISCAVIIILNAYVIKEQKPAENKAFSYLISKNSIYE